MLSSIMIGCIEKLVFNIFTSTQRQKNSENIFNDNKLKTRLKPA